MKSSIEKKGISRIVAISDFCSKTPPDPFTAAPSPFEAYWRAAAAIQTPPRPPAGVHGGYLERLPLACVAGGLCEQAELWTFAGTDDPGVYDSLTDPARIIHDESGLIRRRFRADPHAAPYASQDILAHVRMFGAPDILCIWGLGVDAAVMDACADSITVYNSIDAPAVRIPDTLLRRFNIVLTGAEWQSREVREKAPDALIASMPIGPEFASPETFFPLPLAKDYDLIYVAAAQPYKRHRVLFDALEKLPRTVRALCIFGYGELAGEYRDHCAQRGLNVDFIGPPGISFADVNVCMNRARIGLVCGRDDGAPAILTEYMLAGLPVIANADLACGRQFITPETGVLAREEDFHNAIASMLARAPAPDPRPHALKHWAWPGTVKRFRALIEQARASERMSYSNRSVFLEPP